MESKDFKDDASDEEGEEEEDGFTDDEILEGDTGAASSSTSPSPSATPPKTALKDAAPATLPKKTTPCRRVVRKGSIVDDDVQIVSCGKSRDRQALEDLLKQIQALELSKWGP